MDNKEFSIRLGAARLLASIYPFQLMTGESVVIPDVHVEWIQPCLTPQGVAMLNGKFGEKRQMLAHDAGFLCPSKEQLLAIKALFTHLKYTPTPAKRTHILTKTLLEIVYPNDSALMTMYKQADSMGKAGVLSSISSKLHSDFNAEKLTPLEAMTLHVKLDMQLALKSLDNYNKQAVQRIDKIDASIAEMQMEKDRYIIGTRTMSAKRNSIAGLLGKK